MEIESNIPVPNARPGRYPFAEMKVGDSFAVSTHDERRRLMNAAAGYKWRNPGWGYVTRSENGQTRVWRTA